MEIKQVQKNNYVHIQLAGALEICQVVGVNDKVTVASINDPFENLQFDPLSILPISLTEFWIKELSFEEVTDSSITGDTKKTFVRNGVLVSLQKDEQGKNIIYAKQNGQQSSETIEYVHELQNYYMALKNEAISLP
jgi:hypothetical protein